ncbi:MAG: hypothetical protein M1821_001890 [Bathelium mastoideum]|nr:MAG: hypothetical protein M1821_001890 [Bathelium mastoideum]
MSKRSPDREWVPIGGKKRRIEDGDGGGVHLGQKNCGSQTVTKTLCHSDYTVGVICALALEMTAMRAVLDELHADLAVQSNDENAYTLGSLCGHNVVIACLPAGVYGSTAAAAVACQMLSSFSSITTRLMVGIGGGVPTETHDIRLGDVVVSTPNPQCAAVVQYDYGKTLADGQFHRTGQLNKPPPSLLTAVNKLQAIYGMNGWSQIPEILSDVFKKHPWMKREYVYPGQDLDVLFKPACNHVDEEGQACSTCGLPKTIERSSRDEGTPRVHCGPIASANQVMKHGRTRDRLAQKLGILCFEMEAAGLMDYFQCLVVRGICDYSDARKNKDFQNYAALTAAAYAKELLSTVAPKTATVSSAHQAADPDSITQHRKLIMDCLLFDQAESRRATIKKAHMKTCKWLLQRPVYRDWLDWSKIAGTCGFLWIKGKPGTGKSTIMKFVLTHIERTMGKESVSISFFFNARGTELEKSTIGLYRSLLVQLLDRLPKLQNALDTLTSPIGEDWDIDVLKETFRAVLEKLGEDHLLCFVDALDECPEDQVRDLIEFFEDLSQLTATGQIRLHVCFSSRHYPHISINTGLQLVLENQEGHSDDITNYLSTELKVGKSKLVQECKAKIVEKASGIFLWVVLVARILNREHDRGKIHAMRKRLDEIPVELNELFKDILMRDGENIQELLLCIQWILYAKRPLKREEFYFAILAGSDPSSLSAWDTEEVTSQDMERFVLNSSKGLAEMTRTKDPTIQFIHESVREFLLAKDALANILPGFRGISEGSSHEQLRNCCYNYMRIETSPQLDLAPPLPVASSEEAANMRSKAHEAFPFLAYAVDHVLYHADAAERNGVAQTIFIDHFALRLWINLANLLEKFQARRYTQEASLLYICALADLPNLIGIQRTGRSSIIITGERYGSPLFAAAANGKKDAFKALLTSKRNLESRHGPTFFDLQFDRDLEALVDFICFRKNVKGENCPDLLPSMGRHGDTVKFVLLRDKGVAIGSSPTAKGQEAVCRLLFESEAKSSLNSSTWETVLPGTVTHGQEANVSSPTDKRAVTNPKHDLTTAWFDIAVKLGQATAVRLLVEKGAKIDRTDANGNTPLIAAAKNGSEAVVRLLIENGAAIDLKDFHGNTPLIAAASNGNKAVVKLLVDCGAEIDLKNNYGDSPLIAVARKKNDALVRLLVDKGAEIDLQDHDGNTPLQAAAAHTHNEAVVKLLLNKGAKINMQNFHGDTPLKAAAACDGNEATVRLLIENGARVDLQDTRGDTPLNAAASSGSEAMVKLLVDCGAKTSSKGSQGRTALHLAACRSESMVRLLLVSGAEIDMTDSHGETPLFGAARFGNEVVVRLLWEKGANINAQNKDRETPIWHAAVYGEEDVVTFLLEKGARIDLDNEVREELLQRIALRGMIH